MERILRYSLVVTTLLCLTGTAASTAWLLSPGLRLTVYSWQHPGYRDWSLIDVSLPGLSARRYTLVLFARSTCGACQSSEPAFTELIAAIHKDEGLQAFAIGFDSDNGFPAYAAQLGVGQSNVLVLPKATAKSLRLTAVPTLLIVDSAGRVVRSHMGVLTADALKRMVDVLNPRRQVP